MLEKVLKLLTLYAEEGTVKAARVAVGLSNAQFREALDLNPDLEARYRAIQKFRGDDMVDEAYEVTFLQHDARRARMQADIRLKIAGMYDRARYGERVDLNLNQTVSIAGALADARGRTLRLQCDSGDVSDAQVIDVTPRLPDRATDSQSVTPPDDAPDIFDGA